MQIFLWFARWRQSLQAFWFVDAVYEQRGGSAPLAQGPA